MEPYQAGVWLYITFAEVAPFYWETREISRLFSIITTLLLAGVASIIYMYLEG